VTRGVDTGPVSIATLHPMHVRSPSAAAAALRDADLVLIVECDVPFIPRSIHPNAAATVVHIDSDPLKATMPLWAFPVDIALQADGPTAIAQLADAIEALRATSSAIADVFDDRVAAAGVGEPLAASEQLVDDGIGALDVLLALNEVLLPDDIVVEEAVTNSGLVYQHVVRTNSGTIAGAFAPGLGWALGGAIGVKLAHPERRVISVCGDGSFLFGVPSSALMMAAEMGTPFLTVILNNDGYRASRLPVYDLFPEGASAASGDAVGTTFLSAPNFAALAVACHAHGERVEKRSQLVAALRRCLEVIEGGTAAVLDVGVVQR
jgi:acetolactate synthase I/II/III large subunit